MINLLGEQLARLKANMKVVIPLLVPVITCAVCVAITYADIGNKEILTSDERTWLKENLPRVAVAVETGYPPFVFLDAQGHPTGLAHDYLLLIESKLGVQFRQQQYKSLDEIFAKTRSGEVHIVNAVTKTPARSEFLAFTDPFILVPNVIIVRKERSGTLSEKDLAGLKVSLVKSYAITEHLTNTVPGIQIELVPDNLTAILNVSFGRSDAAVLDLATATFLIDRKSITNLREAGETSHEIKLSLAVPHSEAVLRGILQKGLAAITKEERHSIQERWVHESSYRRFSDRFWITLAAAGASILALLTAVLIWNRTLRRQVAKRTEDLAREKEALQLSEEHHRSILETAIDGIWLVDTGGRLLEVNEAYCRMSGYSEQELLPMNISDLEARETTEATAGHIRKVIAQGVDRFTSKHRRKDGTLFDVEISVQYRTVDGGQFVVFVQDITDRKNAEVEKRSLEKQLQQTQKLESLGVLSGGIAHDFNNILAIIIGHCSLARLNPDGAEKSIPEIEKAAERAAELCRQMLAYAGKTQFVQTQVAMNAVVDDIVNILKASIKQNVVINLYLAPEIPPVQGDASQLRQIVMNMVINAAEAIGEVQGVVNVSLKTVEIRAEQQETDHLGNRIDPGFYVSLEVADTGCGMDDETRQRIFEPFYTTKFTGRGLGMSAVLGIVTSHKGALQLISQPGHGTTFKVYLPVQPGETVQQEAKKIGRTPWLGKGTILLVEDEEQIRMLARTMLENLGFTVLTACNGREALEVYQQNIGEIMLVVTDMGMPVMDGYALVSELKRLNPDIPIIISSGFGEADVTSGIPTEAIAGLIGKPYNFSELREVLQGVVAGDLVQEA